jgi:hypothetical protein
MKNKAVILLFLGFSLASIAQKYTHQDSLRGGITKERAWWDIQYYTLSFEVDPTAKSIQGTNVIRYKVIAENQLLQLDLQNPMAILSVTQDGVPLSITDIGNAHFITLVKNKLSGSRTN